MRKLILGLMILLVGFIVIGCSDEEFDDEDQPVELELDGNEEAVVATTTPIPLGKKDSESDPEIVDDSLLDPAGFIGECYWQGQRENGEWDWFSVEEQFGVTISFQQCYAQDSCNGGLGLSNGGCYEWLLNPEELVGGECYWQGNQNGEWVWFSVWEQFGSDLTMKQCFEQDSCAGGMGVSNGGCYQWEVDGMVVPWQ